MSIIVTKEPILRHFYDQLIDQAFLFHFHKEKPGQFGEFLINENQRKKLIQKKNRLFFDELKPSEKNIRKTMFNSHVNDNDKDYLKNHSQCD